MKNQAALVVLGACALALAAGPASSQSRPRRAAAPPARPSAPPGTELDVHTDRVNALLFSPDRETLLSASGDGTVRLWWVPQGHLRLTLRGHEGGAGDMAVTPDGRTLAVSTYSGKVMIWSLPEGRLLNTITGPEGTGCTLAVSPDGTLLALGRTNGELALVSLPEGTVRATVPAHDQPIPAMTFIGDSVLATGSLDKTVKLWSLPAGELVGALPQRSASTLLAATPDGKLLVSAGGAVQVWSRSDQSLLATVDAHTGFLKGLAITPDGKTLVTAGVDGAIRLWSLPGATLARTIKAHPEVNGVDRLETSADGTFVVSTGWFGTVKVWSMPEGRLRATFSDDTDWLQSTALSPSGLFASGRQSGLIVLRDLASLRPAR
jgi:WD40 repeat protein